MATTPLHHDTYVRPAHDEIRGAALVAHIEAQLALSDAANRVAETTSGSK